MEDVKVVIVDANVIIKGAGQGGGGGWLPQDLRQGARDGSIKVMTIPQVMLEVKDKAARETLGNTLLFDIDIKAPSAEAIAKVKQFARQTGDLVVLSEIDMELIALAYDMEGLHHGLEHILDTPKPVSHVLHSASSKAIKMPGWDPKDDTEWGAEAEEDNSKSRILYSSLDGSAPSELMETDKADATMIEDEQLSPGESSHQASVSPQVYEGSTPDEEVHTEAEEANQANETEDEGDGEWEVAKKSKNAQRKHRRKKLREKENNTSTDGHEEVSMHTEATESNGQKEENSDESVKSTILSLTGDNAMQNVLLQMGFRVLGPKGNVIKELRKWILRCHACGYNANVDLDSIFCPKCGNMNTFRRCQLVASKYGIAYIEQRTNQSLRGTKFSLPLPKGGRHEKPLVLREDTMKKQRNKSKGGPNAFAPEYNEETWFQVTEVNRKSNIMPQGNGLQSVRNPNERRLRRTNRRR